MIKWYGSRKAAIMVFEKCGILDKLLLLLSAIQVGI
jgi:hypothetical protein